MVYIVPYLTRESYIFSGYDKKRVTRRGLSIIVGLKRNIILFTATDLSNLKIYEVNSNAGLSEMSGVINNNGVTLLYTMIARQGSKMATKVIPSC